MKEIDLRCEKIGSYEFSFHGDNTIHADPEIIICKTPQENSDRYSFFLQEGIQLARISIVDNCLEIVLNDGEVAHFLI